MKISCWEYWRGWMQMTSSLQTGTISAEKVHVALILLLLKSSEMSCQDFFAAWHNAHNELLEFIAW